jgi:hypothetical protein
MCYDSKSLQLNKKENSKIQDDKKANRYRCLPSTRYTPSVASLIVIKENANGK